MLPSLLVALAVCVPPPQDELPAAESVLARLEQRLGDAAARGSGRPVVMRGTVQVAGMGAAGAFEELHAGAPGSPEERVRVHQEFTGWPAASLGTDGTVSWTTDPGLGVTIIEGDRQLPARRLWAIGRSAPWRTLYASAETKALGERDGRPVLELEMTARAGGADRWFVDRDSHELLAIAIGMPNPTGGTLPMEYAFSDWRSVNGVRYAGRRVQSVGGMEITYTVQDVEHPAAIEPAALAPPAEVAEAIADRSKRTPTPPERPDECAVDTIQPRTVASIRTVIPADQVSAKLAELLPEVMRTLGEQGVAPAGPPFSRYHRIDAAANEIDIEAGILVKSPIEPRGRVKPGELPGGPAARAWHVGPYHDLPRSYARLQAWMQQQQLVAAGPFWELYWTDPGLEPDPQKWTTQLLWPVAAAIGAPAEPAR